MVIAFRKSAHTKMQIYKTAPEIPTAGFLDLYTTPNMTQLHSDKSMFYHIIFYSLVISTGIWLSKASLALVLVSKLSASSIL